MKAIMIMFDTLSRSYLPNYGNSWIQADNFKRLGKKTVTFDNFYGGSMPCMPARRELHTGRYNFMHRGWGPLEPFDYSIYDTLRTKGIYSHLCTDHSHYFEDGGATYHNRFDSWEGFRGQEGDRWKAHDIDIKIPLQNPLSKGVSISQKQHYCNQQFMKKEEDLPISKTFHAGIDFIKQHQDKDNWFLQIETFDPHEPFYVPQKYRDLYDIPKSESLFNWPAYRSVDSNLYKEDLSILKKEYAALISMCDYYLGKILDCMDDYSLWEDTLLIVNTDHGFLLGEHNWLGKNVAPLYNEIVHLPFFLWNPNEKMKGVRKQQLCQTIDIPATLLDYFKVNKEVDMDGTSLLPILESDNSIREYALFGMHGGHVNITDGHHVYMRGEKNSHIPLVECTMMPTLMRGFFPKQWLETVTIQKGNRFTNYLPYMKFSSQPTHSSIQTRDYFFDVIADPKQELQLQNSNIQKKFENALRQRMIELDVPIEELQRMGYKD